MKKMKCKLQRLKNDITYIFLNYMVCFIPCWIIRRRLYLLFGMTIGKDARIGISTKIVSPKNIVIGNRTVINEMCYFDGRGGIEIGEDSSISFGTSLITGSHIADSCDFKYYTKAIKIEDHVWIGAKSVVLDGTNIQSYCVIGAGCVIKGGTSKGEIYIGNPAKLVRNRECDVDYSIDYHPFFR